MNVEKDQLEETELVGGAQLKWVWSWTELRRVAPSLKMWPSDRLTHDEKRETA